MWRIAPISGAPAVGKITLYFKDLRVSVLINAFSMSVKTCSFIAVHFTGGQWLSCCEDKPLGVYQDLVFGQRLITDSNTKKARPMTTGGAVPNHIAGQIWPVVNRYQMT